LLYTVTQPFKTNLVTAVESWIGCYEHSSNLCNYGVTQEGCVQQIVQVSLICYYKLAVDPLHGAYQDQCDLHTTVNCISSHSAKIKYRWSIPPALMTMKLYVAIRADRI